MNNENKTKFATKCVQSGYTATKGAPQVLPISQNTTYRYFNGEDVAKLFDLESGDFMYSRIGNPTVAALEEKITSLEGGTGSVALSSGMSAVFLTVCNLCVSGDEVLSSTNIYGGTHNLLTVSLKRFGINTVLFNQELPAEDIIAMASSKVKMIFAETIGNPALSIADFEKLSFVAKSLGVPLVIDNTLATPALCRPIEHGADIVINSTTKYADGHATSVGGVVTESGKFDWSQNDKFPTMTEPDESYHGLRFYQKFKQVGFTLRLRAVMLRDFGCAMAPMNAFMTTQGLQTLHIRMARHSENAMKLAEYLDNHDMVKWVNYPNLKDNDQYQLSSKYLPDGASGVLCFGIKGGKEAGGKFIEALKMTSLVVHVGDIRTSVLHPASSTHRQLSEAEQRNAGINPDLIRVSVGLEDISDIINDFEQSLNTLS